jgi:hypothetical protein
MDVKESFPLIVVKNDRILIFFKDCHWYEFQEKNNFNTKQISQGCINLNFCGNSICTGLCLKKDKRYNIELFNDSIKIIHDMNLALLNLKNDNRFLRKISMAMMMNCAIREI